MTVHIGFNLLGYHKFTSEGIKNYSHSLIQAILEMNTEHRYTIFYHDGLKPLFQSPFCNVSYQSCPSFTHWQKMNVIWRDFFSYKMIQREKLDVLHSLSNIAPWRLPCRSVVTLYDVIGLKRPHLYSGMSSDALYWKYVLRRSAKKADAIVTLSGTSQKAILEMMPFLKHKITTIYSGIPLDISKENVQAPTSLFHKPYFLWMGRFMSHKNVERLVVAYEKYRSCKEDPAHLILFGLEGPTFNCVQKYVHRKNLTSYVHIYLNQERHILLQYLKHAQALVFPSLEEGFGFPPLEAMSLGVPVLCSDISIFQEILGDAALRFNPYVPESIVHALREIVLDPHFRKNLIQRGYDQVKKYPWQACAQKTIAVYESMQ
ncbi:MAG: glycosyltransferase family 4 protein [Deltaproteobacteria bacterium]|nr:glycosyltransferase family 4 protein [Deltaproteobacteria bacterium]